MDSIQTVSLGDSLPWLAAKISLSIFQDGSCILFIMHLLYILAFRLNSGLSFCSVKNSVQMLVLVNFQFLNDIVRIVFDYFSAVVQYSDPGNVFEIFDPIEVNP